MVYRIGLFNCSLMFTIGFFLLNTESIFLIVLSLIIFLSAAIYLTIIYGQENN